MSNWPEYERSLVQRGDITLWLSPDTIATWNAKPTRGVGARILNPDPVGFKYFVRAADRPNKHDLPGLATLR